MNNLHPLFSDILKSHIEAIEKASQENRKNQRKTLSDWTEIDNQTNDKEVTA